MGTGSASVDGSCIEEDFCCVELLGDFLDDDYFVTQYVALSRSDSDDKIPVCKQRI